MTVPGQNKRPSIVRRSSFGIARSLLGGRSSVSRWARSDDDDDDDDDVPIIILHSRELASFRFACFVSFRLLREWLPLGATDRPTDRPTDRVPARVSETVQVQVHVLYLHAAQVR